jgi:hypothetical protein
VKNVYVFISVFLVLSGCNLSKEQQDIIINTSNKIQQQVEEGQQRNYEIMQRNRDRYDAAQHQQLLRQQHSPRNINCTTNTVGQTTYTNCY